MPIFLNRSSQKKTNKIELFYESRKFYIQKSFNENNGGSRAMYVKELYTIRRIVLSGQATFKNQLQEKIGTTSFATDTYLISKDQNATNKPNMSDKFHKMRSGDLLANFSLNRISYGIVPCL